MNILESAIKLIAPHNCLVCKTPDHVLCEACSLASLTRHPSRCYRCHQATTQSKTCPNCRKKTGISHVWIAAAYETAAKKLVYKLKFERAGAASKDIAREIQANLPILPAGTVITHLPTANNRIRARGYDQAQLIAKSLAKTSGLAYRNLLGRKGAARQTGSSRTNRFEQLKDAFFIRQESKVSGAHILLVDDVLTTGASVESAAKALKNAGAKTIDVAVFAQP